MALSIHSSNLVDLGSLPITGYPFTMTGWFRVPNINVAMTLMRFNDTATGTDYEMLFGGHSTNWAGILVATPLSKAVKSTTAMIPGQWHQVTGVFESNTNRTVYLDGGNSGSSELPRAFNGADSFVLGNFRTNDYVDVAEAAVINRALTVEEIEQLALGLSMLSLPAARNTVTYLQCIRRLNQPGIGPVASAGQPLGVVDHPRMFSANLGSSAAMPFRRRGPLHLDRGECQSSFSEQAELAVVGVDSDNTLHYGEVLS